MVKLICLRHCKDGTLVPEVFLEIFLRERESEAAKRQEEREAPAGPNEHLSLLAASRSLSLSERKISGYKDGYGRRKFSSEILK